MYKICIDPGHGGSDPGATNGAAQEKVVTLDVGLRVQKLLQDSGHEVIMTREHDFYATPKAKAQVANQVGAELFVSIHTNSATSPEAHGTETWFYEGSEEGRKLAIALNRNMVNQTKLTDRGIKSTKKFDVLSCTKMTAALVEIAFISNAEEKKLLYNNGFKAHAAQAIHDGIIEYIKEEEAVATKKEVTIEEKKKVVQNECGFDDNTMLYLEMYRYGEALIDRIYEKVKGA